MFIITYRKFFYAFSSVVITASVVAIALWGLKPGIDFRGGSLLEITYQKDAPTESQVHEALAHLSLGDASVRKTGELGYIIRLRELTDSEHEAVKAALSFGGAKPLTEGRFDSVGPVLGSEAARKSLLSILLVIICIVLFITFAFRRVSEPVSSWKYGVIAIVALLHDVIVPAGAFAVLAHFTGAEADTLFVTALLVVLGFSVHDTIVVFDRVRENLKVSRENRDRKDFATIVGESIAQTFVRSVNTSLTTLLALLALYLLGPEITRTFSLVLIIGITAGTYSSIFLGSPLLVTVEKWQNKGK